MQTRQANDMNRPYCAWQAKIVRSSLSVTCLPKSGAVREQE